MHGTEVIEKVLKVLKQKLKEQKIKYSDLAKNLKMSESGLKKLLSNQDISLKRLNLICQTLNMPLAAVIGEATKEEVKNFRFTEEQEIMLLKNKKLFGVYWKLICEQRSEADTLLELKIKRAELDLHIHTLEKMGLIHFAHGALQLPPPERINWIGNGPLMKWIKEEWPIRIVRALIKDEIDPKQEHYSLRFYYLTETSLADLTQSIREIDTEFSRRSIRERSLKPGPLKAVRMVSAISPGSFF
jgi:transcriptional regulator with XRE-family HTH domain